MQNPVEEDIIDLEDGIDLAHTQTSNHKTGTKVEFVMGREGEEDIKEHLVKRFGSQVTIIENQLEGRHRTVLRL